MLWELGHRFECSLRIRWDSWYFLVVVQNDNLMLDITSRNIKQIVGRGRCYPNNQKFEEPREGYKNYKNEWRTQEVMKLFAICILLVTVDWITLFLSVSLSQVSTSLFSTPFFLPAFLCTCEPNERWHSTWLVLWTGGRKWHSIHACRLSVKSSGNYE